MFDFRSKNICVGTTFIFVGWRLLYLLLEPALACGYLSLGSGQKEAILGKWKCIIRQKEKATSWEIPEGQRKCPCHEQDRCPQNSPKEKRSRYSQQQSWRNFPFFPNCSLLFYSVTVLSSSAQWGSSNHLSI